MKSLDKLYEKFTTAKINFNYNNFIELVNIIKQKKNLTLRKVAYFGNDAKGSNVIDYYFIKGTSLDRNTFDELMKNKNIDFNMYLNDIKNYLIGGGYIEKLSPLNQLKEKFCKEGATDGQAKKVFGKPLSMLTEEEIDELESTKEGFAKMTKGDEEITVGTDKIKDYEKKGYKLIYKESSDDIVVNVDGKKRILTVSGSGKKGTDEEGNEYIKGQYGWKRV